ncbi:MAG TPA: hypothetical protein VJK03_00990 [Candidatus Nanoarchaeia archaeon]|nr:hypothetical protein [Candidatus Nanoarchaeia archaeon]
MAVDLTSVSDFLPLLSFLVVFVLVFAVLVKTKVVENTFFQLFIAFLLATMFITASGARTYIENIVPWFAVLLVCLFFVLALTGFVGKDVEFMNKGVGILFIIGLILVFLISAGIIFSSTLQPYYEMLAGRPRLYGALLLLGVSAVVGWVLVKGKGK